MTCSNSKLRVCTHYSRWKAVVYIINAKCRKRASQSFTDNRNTEWGEVGIWIQHHVKVWKKACLFVCCEKYWNGFYWYHPQLFVNGNMKNVEPSEPDCLVETKLKETALHCTLSKLFLSTLSSHIFYVRLKTIPTFLHVHWKSYWSLHMFLLSILALENPFWHDSHVLTVATWWGGAVQKCFSSKVHPQLMWVCQSELHELSGISFKVTVFVEWNSLLVLLFLPCISDRKCCLGKQKEEYCTKKNSST